MARHVAPVLSLALVFALGATSARPAVDPVAKASELVAALEKGDFDAAVASFDATMKGALPAEALGQAWTQLTTDAGSLTGRGTFRTMPAPGITVVLQRLEFERAALDLKVAVTDATGEIAGLFFVPPSDAGVPVAEGATGDPAPPSVAPAAATPARDLAVGLLDRIVTRDFDGAASRLGGPLASMLSAEKLTGIWADLVERLGALQRADEPSVQDLGGGSALVVQRLVFERGELDMKTTVHESTGQVVGLFFAPALAEAAPPPADAPFVERPITVGSGGGALEGLLTLPRGDGPWPCAVLVHGSGPQDRDETIGPNKPFRDLAWGLAERGVATVRYDKRTLAHAQALAGMAGSLTLEHETVLDAVAAVRLARSLPGIDASRVVVAGHSLGGSALPRIAEKAPGLAALVFLAASAEPLEDAIVRQSEHIAGLDGSIDADERAALDVVRAQAAFVKSPELSAQTSPALLPLGVPAAYWLDLRRHDPAADAALVPLPMLFVQGGRDYQVTVAELERFRRALAGRRDVTFRLFANLNHLFGPGQGPSGPTDYVTRSPVASEVIEAVATFVKGLPGS